MKAKTKPSYTLEPDNGKSKVVGLSVRTTKSGFSAYVFERRLSGRSVRTTIGAVGDWKRDAARVEARRLAVLMDQGKDPRIVAASERAAAEATRSDEQRQAHILRGVWGAYIEDCRRFWGDRHHRMHLLLAAPGGERKKRGKGLTKPGPLAPLMALKLSELTAETISIWLRREVAKRATNAHQSYRLLKTFVRWANERPDYKGIISADACSASSVTREVPSSKTKDGDCLQKEQLPAWFKSVQAIPNPVIAAYLQVLLLTGARRNELATLKRADVDFTWNTMTIRDKVEGERTIPLTPYVASLLAKLPKRNDWMFPSNSKTGRLMEPRIAHDGALKVGGLPHVSLHGLRRSFRTLSEWCEIPTGVIAQIQGHKPSAIAEKNYTRRPIDLLRLHHSKLEAWILEQGGVPFAPLPAGKRLGVVAADGRVRAAS